jgi:hypothetical protein
MQSYVPLLGMAGYSLMTLFVKLAERSGSATTYMVLAVHFCANARKRQEPSRRPRNLGAGSRLCEARA